MIKSIFLILALSQSPTDTTTFTTPQDIIEQAVQLEAKGEYEKAIVLYSSISESDTSFLQMQSRLLPNYNELKQYDKTIALGEKLKGQHSPFRNTVYISLGNAYLNSDNFEMALKTYEEGLKLFPKYHLLIYNMGYAYYKNDDMINALAYFQKSAMINPFYAGNHIMLGYLSTLQGHRSKAVLSYMMYMGINPDKNNTLVFLNRLVSDGVKNEGSVEEFVSNDDFKYYDDLLKSKVALDKRYVSQVKFNANVAKQADLLISKIEYNKDSEDFWMQFYVPFYQSLRNKDLSTAFIYSILTSTNNEEVTDWLEKHETQNDQWIDLANEKLELNRSPNTAEILGVTDNYSHWYYNNNLVSAIGNELSDEIRQGPWLFFNDNNTISTVGKYNMKGEKVGVWNYYHDNGRLSRKEIYNDSGDIIEPSVYYHDNGARSIIANFDKDDEIDGTLEYYYDFDRIKEKAPYIHGAKTGKGQIFYETGQLKADYELVDGEAVNDYIEYYKNGQIKALYQYSDNVLNGAHKSYYIDGQPNEVGFYTNDSLSGDWNGYHQNGEKSYTGSFKSGKRQGKWTYLYNNGNLKETYEYNDNGDIHGEVKYYNEDGIVYNIDIYKDGELKGYKYLDEDGKILSEGYDESGNMTYISYTSKGDTNVETTLKNGKVDGQYISYHYNGSVDIKSSMVKGNFHGTYEEFYPTGQLYVKATYDSGSLNGYYQVFFKNGQLNMDGWYVDGQAEQLWKTYYPDGSLGEENYYIGGKLNGWNKIYAKGEKLNKAYNYEMGIVTGLKQYDSLGNVYHNISIPYGNGIRTLKSISGDTLFAVKTQAGQFISDIVNHYPGGKIQSSYSIKDALYQGEYVYNSPLGKLVIKGQYKDNLKEGKWLWYDTEGNIESEYNYTRGELSGEIKEYYSNGQVESLSVYDQGKRVGPVNYFDQLGNLQLIKFYDQQRGNYSYVNIQKMDTIQTDKKGVFELKSFFPNGKLAVSQRFKNGFFYGTNKYYNLDGTLVESTDFVDGDYHGKKKRYFSNGKLHLETEYQNDTKNGVEREYYPNGKLKRVSPYFNDVLNGTMILYDINGKVKSKTLYWNGEIY